MIVRAGIGELTIADADVVGLSNINRQLVALHSTIGRQKCDILSDRLKDINPELELKIVNRFIKDSETDALLDSDKFDYVVDAIDTLSPKLALIKGSLDRGIPIVSSMGSGGKLDPSKIEVAGIYDLDAMKMDGLFCNMELPNNERGFILSEFDSNLSSLSDGRLMFNSCKTLTLFTADLSSLTNSRLMFYGCSKLNY